MGARTNQLSLVSTESESGPARNTTGARSVLLMRRQKHQQVRPERTEMVMGSERD